MESVDINNYLILNEKLAFINGYLNSIAILNTIPNNVMEHWLIDLGVIEEDLDTTFKKGIQAPNWTFKATEISNWQKVIDDECYYFFSEVLYKIQGSKAYYESKGRQFDLMEKYNLEHQLKYFIKMLENLFSFCKLKTVYRVDIDNKEDWYNPYFAHGEYNYAFEIESKRIIHLHFGAWD
jgi:hypothetical protein